MSLTKQQAKVRDLILSGRTNKQIAKVMGVAESIVKLHVGSVLKNAGVKNRAQLIAWDKSGQVVKPVEVATEPDPFCWVHRHGDKVTGILFTKKQPKEGWEPLYFKGKST